MKLSSASTPISSTLLPRGYFSKCSGKPIGVKGTPLKSKQNIKSKAFYEKKESRASRSVEEVSEFETNCSSIERQRFKQRPTQRQSSKNNEILIVSSKDQKEKNDPSSNGLNIMLKGLKDKNEQNNLEEELQKVLLLIKEEKELARYRIEEIYQNKQKESSKSVDACNGTEEIVLEEEQKFDKEIQTTETKCTNQQLNEDKENVDKIRILINDMKIGHILGQGMHEDQSNGIKVSDMKEKEVIRLNKVIIRKLVQTIMDLQTL